MEGVTEGAKGAGGATRIYGETIGFAPGSTFEFARNDLHGASEKTTLKTNVTKGDLP